jgi:diguanylate cyclase (GGDEF)-like protein
MKNTRPSKLLKSAQPATSLTEVLGQSERVKDIVEECVDDLSTVNADLENEFKGVESLPGVEEVLEKSQAVENKVQNVSEELALVNQALKEEVEERLVLEERLATATKQGDEARHAALHDPLTGLPNRALFNDRLEHGLAQAKRHGSSLAVMFLDLDDFKEINDTHGHEVGDVVLQTIATRLRQSTRGEDTVCRHGGDEFLYMVLELRNKQDITVVAKKIIKAIQAPCDIRLRDISLSLSIAPSIGIAIYPIDGTTPDSLVNNADKAMYWAKQNKSGYSFGGNSPASPS